MRPILYLTLNVHELLQLASPPIMHPSGLGALSAVLRPYQQARPATCMYVCCCMRSALDGPGRPWTMAGKLSISSSNWPCTRVVHVTMCILLAANLSIYLGGHSRTQSIRGRWSPISAHCCSVLRTEYLSNHAHWLRQWLCRCASTPYKAA